MGSAGGIWGEGPGTGGPNGDPDYGIDIALMGAFTSTFSSLWTDVANLIGQAIDVYDFYNERSVPQLPNPGNELNWDSVKFSFTKQHYFSKDTFDFDVSREDSIRIHNLLRTGNDVKIVNINVH